MPSYSINIGSGDEIYPMRIPLRIKRISVFIVLFLLLLQAFTLQATSTEEHSSTYEAKQILPENIIDAGEGWANNAINTTIYRHHGIVTSSNYQYLAFLLMRSD